MPDMPETRCRKLFLLTRLLQAKLGRLPRILRRCSSALVSQESMTNFLCRVSIRLSTRNKTVILSENYLPQTSCLNPIQKPATTILFPCTLSQVPSDLSILCRLEEKSQPRYSIRITRKMACLGRNRNLWGEIT